jgi:geranylgeranyl reductase family protein
MDHFDVAIIGAGPAGSTAAIALARRGYAVALLDKQEFPRDKLCGDFINPSGWPTLDRLGVSRRLFLQDHEIVTAFHISAANGAVAETALPSLDGAPVYGLGLRRIIFDQILFDQARTEGVAVLPGCPVKGLRRAAEGWRVGYGRDETIKELNASMLIGADGRNSRVAHHLGMAGSAARGAGRIGFQLRLRDPLKARGKVEIHLFPGGYAGVLGLGDGTINLCLVVDGRALGRHVGVEELVASHLPHNPHLKEMLRRSEPLGKARSTYPIYFPPRRSADDRVILIGDAARVSEPVSGEGIFFALRSALIAAAVIDDGFCRMNFSAARLADYERRCRSEFRVRRGLNGAIRFLMRRPALLEPCIHLSSKKRRLLESLVGAICRPQTAV